MCVSSETHDAPSRRFVEPKQHKGKHAKRPTHQALSDVTAIASRRFDEFSAAPRGSGEAPGGAQEEAPLGGAKASCRLAVSAAGSMVIVNTVVLVKARFGLGEIEVAWRWRFGCGRPAPRPI